MLAEKRRRRADWELLSELGPTCSNDDVSLELAGKSRERCCRKEVRLPLGELLRCWTCTYKLEPQ